MSFVSPTQVYTDKMNTPKVKHNTISRSPHRRAKGLKVPSQKPVPEKFVINNNLEISLLTERQKIRERAEQILGMDMISKRK